MQGVIPKVRYTKHESFSFVAGEYTEQDSEFFFVAGEYTEQDRLDVALALIT